MIWVAIILGTFLFYRFVERKHKILFFKASSALLLLVGLVAIIYFGYQSYTDSRFKNGISVEFEFKDIETDKENIKKMVDSAFEKISPSIGSYFIEIPVVDYGKVKTDIFSAYIGVDDDPAYLVRDLSDDELIAHFNWIKSKSIVSEKKLREFEVLRLKAVLASLPSRRLAVISKTQRYQFVSFLRRIRESFALDDIKAEFFSKLLPDEKSGIDNFLQLRDLAYQALYAKINLRKDLKTILSFNICNKLNRPLLSYTFVVAGFDKGRSTAQSLRQTGDYGSSTNFFGDIIIEPNKCQPMQWTGNYKFFDRYEVSNVHGSWANEGEG